MKTINWSVDQFIVKTLLLSIVLLPVAVSGAVTDLANGPLASGITNEAAVKPNIAFVVDDSGSMTFESMPADDDYYERYGDTTHTRDKRCFGWYKFNTVFYNPGVTYKPPFKLDGTKYSDGVTRFPDADFNAALFDGYFASGGVTFTTNSKITNTKADLSVLSNLSPAPVACVATASAYATISSDGKFGSGKCYQAYSITVTVDGKTVDLLNSKTVPSDRDCNGNPDTFGQNVANRINEQQAENGGFTATYIDRWNYPNTIVIRAPDRLGNFTATPTIDFRNMDPNTGTETFSVKAFVGGAAGECPTETSKYYYSTHKTDPNSNTCEDDSNYSLVTSADEIAAPDVEKGSDAAKKNYANWYSYYRTRAGLMKAATGEAFKDLEVGKYRAGLFFINSLSSDFPSPYTGRQNHDLKIADFTGATATTQRYEWYSKLYGSREGGGTPLRVALSRMGRMYAGKFSSLDPVQYSCQQNFTILSTDGFWNDKEDASIAGYGPRDIDGTVNVGDQDGASTVEVPYKDDLKIPDTLADVAQYYYATDLRDESHQNCTNKAGTLTDQYTDLCKNNVGGSGKDTSNKQHMTTFTVGLGVSGTITYESNYETAKNLTGITQYADIVNGGADWPDPTKSEAAKIDDLWHAAVNGRGTYYSASDSTTLKQGIQSALAGIKARKGSSSAAATSNLEPVAGDNFVYVALYQTVKWDGDLQAYSIDPDTGALSGTKLWSAQTALDSQVTTALAASPLNDGRKIKFFSSGATDKLAEFTYANLPEGVKSHFENICTKSPTIDQCGSDQNDLTDDQKTIANSGTNLVNYLRGRPTLEDEAANATEANRIYRGRDHVLGDIVNAVPVYMKKPPFSYDTFDSSYATFKTDNKDRAATVFVAANDGMLHAINADNTSTAKGQERWAYVPLPVMKNMWNLADRNYANNHRYYVDGSPTVADICTSLDTKNSDLCASATRWKTILVGGLNKGGCGYYALDVTDPTNPKGMWEFTNENLGYSYGNPIVARRKSDGRWVVIVASGYNNVPNNGCGTSGDGNGHVFVLDADSGDLLDDIETYDVSTVMVGMTPTIKKTEVGSTSTPSGLAKLNAWIENASLPYADRLYGGDMLGNVWRIDFDNRYPPAAASQLDSGKEAVRLAQLKDGSTNTQPITTKPELAMIKSGVTQYPIVMVGTGKYLGIDDIDDASQQSLYAFKDSLGATGIDNIRGSSMVERILTDTTGAKGGTLEGRTIRKVTGDAMDWATDDGWYLDLNPDNTSPGERVNVDMSLQFNILTVAANVPATNACDVGGYGFLYFLDINNGLNLSTAREGMAGVRLMGNALVAGIKTVKLTSGKTVTIVTDTAGNVTSEDNPSATGGGAGSARRTTWREIPD